MTVRDRATLQTEADTVAAEVIEGANTAARVGGLLRDLADSIALTAELPAQTGLVVAGTPSPGYFVRADAAGAAYWGTDAAYNITSFQAATPLVQIGATVVAPAFTAVHSLTPISLQLTNSDNPELKSVVATPNAFASSQNYTKNTPASVTFTLTGNDGLTSSVATRNITWCNRIYYGAAVPAAFNEAFVEALASNSLQTTGNRTFTLAATATQHKYFAFPTRLGTAAVAIGGFTYGWTVISTTISVTNSDGFTENYTLIENENLGVASETITVTVS
jgi:hypothetical protein